MAKYNAKMLAECEHWIEENGLIEHGGAKLKDFCRAMCINDRTYRNWLKKDGFKEAIERGRNVFKNNLSQELVLSLAKSAKGYEVEDMVTEYRPNTNNQNEPMIRRMQKTKKHIAPNVAAAIFLLTNIDPEHYQNRQRNDVSFKKNEDQDMSLEEINNEIARLDKLDKQCKEDE